MPLHIVESTGACSYEQRRRYAKRRSRSSRHHARINKKWIKRFGFQMVPMAYMMGDTLIVHPLLAPQYRKAINGAFKPAGPANYPGENWL